MAGLHLNLFRQRSAFGGSEGELGCHAYEDAPSAPISGDLTLHDVFIYTSFCCMIACLISTGLLFMRHMKNYREPRYQKQIMRIMLTPAVFAVFSFLGVWSYRLTDYLHPVAEVYEAFAFIAVLFLMLAYALPSSEKLDDQIAFFLQHPRMHYRHFRRTYWMMIQFLPVSFLCTIVTEITMATNCVGGREWKRANLVIGIVSALSTILALFGFFKGYNGLKIDMKKTQPKVLGQIFIFKVIVFLQLVQGLLLSILKSTDTLEPTSTMSYNDVNLGLEPFMTCCESLLISCGMWYFYSPRLHGRNGDYVQASDGSSNKDDIALDDGVNRGVLTPKLGAAEALFDVVNLYDIFQGMGNALWLLFHRRVNGHR